MEAENYDKIERTSQKILNRLISEERIAGDLYLGAVKSAKPECVAAIAEKFTEIAKDELEDHMMSLQKFALDNGFEIPFKYSEYEKHSSKKLANMFHNMKRGQDALYYVEIGIKAEIEAIKSYEEVLDDENLQIELQPLLLKCYYEELQHLKDLRLLEQCVALGVQMA